MNIPNYPLSRLLHSNFIKLAAFALFSGVAATSSATVIYNEAIDGDLPGAVTLVSGINDILGSSFFSTALGSDPDSFSFTAPSGLSVTSIDYLFSNVVLESPGSIPALDRIEVRPGLRDELDNVIAPLQIIKLIGSGAVASPVAMFPSVMPLASGTYQFTSTAFLRQGDGGSWDYTVRVNAAAVSVIPEPGSAALLLGGALIGLRKLRRPAALPAPAAS